MPSDRVLTRRVSFDTLSTYKKEFKKVAQGGALQPSQLQSVLEACGVKLAGYKVREIVEGCPGTITCERYLQILEEVTPMPSFATADMKDEAEGNVIIESGASKHYYSEEEKVAFIDWINLSLQHDQYLRSVSAVPVKEDGLAIFSALKDGILMSKLINHSVPNTVDERALNIPKPGAHLSVFEMLENQKIVINSCVAIGCKVVNIRTDDLVDGVPHLCLGLLWQIIRIGLMANISLKKCPGLRKLLHGDETVCQLMAMSPETILYRWVNYQLEQAGQERRIKNFGKDISDSEVYTYLLKEICPKDRGPITLYPLQIEDKLERAEAVLENADKLESRMFVRPKEIVSGHQRLNTAFVANLFNHYPNLEDEEGEEIEEDVEETREEKSMRHWMNSLDVEPYVTYIYEDLKDGWILIQLYNKICPGIVDWNRVNRPPFNNRRGFMRKLENCNYCVELGKHLNFSLVGIGGNNICEGNKLVLSIVWQMMRYHTLAMLKRDGVELKDQEVVDWCNGKLVENGKVHKFEHFKDQRLSTAMPLIDLIDALSPGCISYDAIARGDNAEEKFDNARYAITMARKVGARIFCLPEDIVEVNPKMNLVVFATLMYVGRGNQSSAV